MKAKKFVSAFSVVALASVMFAALAAAATVEVKNKDGVGSYLADEKGMTLYLFKKDTPGKSACSGPCV